MNKLLSTIETVVGPGGLLLGTDVSSRSDAWPPMGGCRAAALVRPATTGQVSEVLQLCHAAGQSVVAHGGLTGLVGGTKAGQDELVLSLERMRGLEPVDTINRTVIAEAGVPLQQLQSVVADAGLLFPLDLGARGSCTIGGNISTNAGGNSVIRYGMMREQVLGIEAVLADGTIISALKAVIKNNTGYDLKQLFIGSEGTLGIVTRAVLRLRPAPRSCNTALLGVADFERLGQLLRKMDAELGGTLSAFEVMWNDFYQLVAGVESTHGLPLEPGHRYYVLIESTGGNETADRACFESTLAAALEGDLVADAVIAQSQKQRQALWDIRDDVETLHRKMFPAIVFDISLGIPQMEAYVEQVREQLNHQWPGSQMVVFGHIGDGNIHLVIGLGALDEAKVRGVESIVYAALGACQGVISAEHGIGLDKRQYLKYSRSEQEIELMRTLKRALDPKGILNPGKIFTQEVTA